MATTPAKNSGTSDIILNILKMILLAEPAIVQVVHDFLVGTGGKSDQSVLTQDLADWQAIADKAKAQLPAASAPPAKS